MNKRVNCGKPNGESVAPMVIRSQATGSARGTVEGSETRVVSSTSNKRLLERPPSRRDEEIVRSSVEMRSSPVGLGELDAPLRSVTTVANRVNSGKPSVSKNRLAKVIPSQAAIEIAEGVETIRQIVKSRRQTPKAR